MPLGIAELTSVLQGAIAAHIFAGMGRDDPAEGAHEAGTRAVVMALLDDLVAEALAEDDVMTAGWIAQMRADFIREGEDQ